MSSRVHQTTSTKEENKEKTHSHWMGVHESPVKHFAGLLTCSFFPFFLSSFRWANLSPLLVKTILVTKAAGTTVFVGVRGTSTAATQVE
jgi:hypothetical protein